MPKVNTELMYYIKDWVHSWNKREVMEFRKTVFLLLLEAYVVLAYLDCIHRYYGYDGTVCVCNATYCDYIGPIKRPKSSNAIIYTSNKEGFRFKKTIVKFQKYSSDNVDINVTRCKTYQKIHGFGGAFTEATGINIKSVTHNVKAHIMKSYFSSQGIEYSLCRIPMGSTDYSEAPYTYDDGDADPELKNFAITHQDKEYKIPYIKLALHLTRGKLKLFTSPWTSPVWMKSSGQYVGGSLKPEMYQTWANYYIKFLDTYKRYGIKFWGVTTGNEPSLASFFATIFFKIPALEWTPGTMAKWVGENLGPTLEKNGYGNISIMALDDQRFYIPWFMDLVFKNEDARKYIAGTAVHGYFDEVFPSVFVRKLHENYPNKFIMATETCKGALFWDKGLKLGSWSRAGDFAADIMENLLNWVTGYIDWNMALNTEGGPTFTKNFVDSSIIVNASSDEFYKQPTFYAMGHFSKFIPRDSLVIDIGTAGKIPAIAVKRPDNGITIVLLNKNNYPLNVTIADSSKGTVILKISANSITSVLYW